MPVYNLPKILDVFTDVNDYSDVNNADYKSWIDNYLKAALPDFLVVFDLKKKDSIVYSKNYNLEFEEGRNETYHEILNSIDSNQLLKVLEVDKKILNFFRLRNLQDSPIKNNIALRFTASLIEGKPQTYLRNVQTIKNDSSNVPQIVLVTINNVTELLGIKEHAYVNVKVLEDLNAEFKTLKSELNAILRPKISLTKREKEVLILISQGKISSEIADLLFISAKTVNTHRQNLIKKFNVKNTAALIQKL